MVHKEQQGKAVLRTPGSPPASFGQQPPCAIHDGQHEPYHPYTLLYAWYTFPRRQHGLHAKVDLGICPFPSRPPSEGSRLRWSMASLWAYRDHRTAQKRNPDIVLCRGRIRCRTPRHNRISRTRCRRAIRLRFHPPCPLVSLATLTKLSHINFVSILRCSIFEGSLRRAQAVDALPGTASGTGDGCP